MTLPLDELLVMDVLKRPEQEASMQMSRIKDKIRQYSHPRRRIGLYVPVTGVWRR
jgi:hypothetical protein